MKNTLTNILRKLGFTPKQIKRIMNRLHYSFHHANDVSNVVIDGDWVRFHLDNYIEGMFIEMSYAYLTR